ncbi:uncharacterized protein LOC135822331 [Sycon ciliatum]|uniref:uncharacterized protein LOC135822331 n=1 Tax=Sycon ciliatum TaxID=27933 RepID=UPI0020AA1CC2|eukprot:scpid79162/ scgid20423/ 
MAALVSSCRRLQPVLSKQSSAFVRNMNSHQQLVNFPKPKARGPKALPVKIVNPTPSGFMDYDAELEVSSTGRQYGFAPTPHPLPSHETMWEGFTPQMKGHTPKKRAKKRCNGRMVFNVERQYLPHKSICAFCRSTAENKSTNLMFLMNFIHPISWNTYRWTVSGLCQYAEAQVRILLEDARANGFLPRHPPPITTDKHWQPPGEMLDLRHYAWYTRDERKRDMRKYALDLRYSKQFKHRV